MDWVIAPPLLPILSNVRRNRANDIVYGFRTGLERRRPDPLMENLGDV